MAGCQGLQHLQHFTSCNTALKLPTEMSGKPLCQQADAPCRMHAAPEVYQCWPLQVQKSQLIEDIEGNQDLQTCYAVFAFGSHTLHNIQM